MMIVGAGLEKQEAVVDGSDSGGKEHLFVSFNRSESMMAKT